MRHILRLQSVTMTYTPATSRKEGEWQMNVSARQLAGAVVVSFCVGAFIAPVLTQTPAAPPAPSPTAAAKQPTYMIVEFMKVPEGREAAWLKLEREAWKPTHALRVKEGLIQSWSVIAQTMPGDESNGPVFATVTTFRGWPDPTKTDWMGMLQKANPSGDGRALMEQTGAARKIVRSEVWQVLEQTDPTK
jgi:hypothetical protein